MAFLKIRADEEDLRKWKARAVEQGMDFSKWVRGVLTRAGLPTESIAEAAAKQKTKKFAKTGVESKQSTLPREEMCSHDYGPGKCVFPNCRYYKWRK